MITFFLDLYDRIYNFLTSNDFSSTLLVLKLISWSISLFFIILIVILLKKSEAAWWIKEGRVAGHYVYRAKKLDKKWQTIQARLKRGDEANLKLAIIEADNLFDDILKRMALPGVDMAERLRQFEKHELKSVDLIWEAHRWRNQIVHEPGVHISLEQAEQAIKGYEAALKELEYLS